MVAGVGGRARVENTGPQGLTRSGAVVGDEFIFTHESRPGEAEYVPAEPETLVWALARMADLHRDFTAEADSGEMAGSTSRSPARETPLPRSAAANAVAAEFTAPLGPRSVASGRRGTTARRRRG